MKRNGEKQSADGGGQDTGVSVAETPSQGNGATTMVLPSAGQADQPRPEVAVLGWNIRSYRLALRESKA